MSFYNYKVVTVKTVEDILELRRTAEKVKLVAFDTETSGLDPYTLKPLLIQLSVEVGGTHNVFIITGHVARESPEIMEHVKAVLENDSIKVLIHNATFDYKVMRHCYNIRTTNMHDTLVIESSLTLGKLLNVGLADVVKRRLGLELEKSSRNEFIGRSNDVDFPEHLMRYAAKDVVVLPAIYRMQNAEIDQLQLRNIERLENNILRVTAELEYNGVLLDTDKWETLTNTYQGRLVDAVNKLAGIIGKPVQYSLFDDPMLQIQGVVKSLNLGSSDAILKYLNEEGLDISETGKKTLKANIKNSNLIGPLLDFRKYMKLVTTYMEPLPGLINPVTGRIHPRYIQIATRESDSDAGSGTTTGRYACTSPNIQQLPADNDIRTAFTAREGKKIIIADYSGCEVIIATNMSRDPALVEFYNSGLGDIHGYVASKMFKLPVELCIKTTDSHGNEVDPKYKNERARAKAVVFGTFYGQGNRGLAALQNISEEEAESFITEFKNSFPQLDRFLNNMGRVAINTGTTRTSMGRIKFLDNTDRKNFGRISRQAKNFPIQGGNADILKLSMHHLRKAFSEDELKIIMTVHDEIVVEVPAERAQEIHDEMKHIMIQYANIVVPGPVSFAVGTKISNTWEK